MAGIKRSATDFPNITRSQFAKILDIARKTRYVRCPYLAMRDASLLAFEFLFKTRVSEGVVEFSLKIRKIVREVSFSMSMRE